MHPEAVLLLTFLAGALAGVSIAILASLRNDFTASLRHFRRVLREQRSGK